MLRVKVTLERRTHAAGVMLALLAGCGGAVLKAPVVTTQPAALTVVAGQQATFKVTTSGSAPAYQWTKNGTAVAGATAASYTTPATTPADDQALFAVTATNKAGSVQSTGAMLRVNFVSLTQSPGNVNVASGSDASFTVAATGSGTLSYQWQKDGSNIDGATSATYDIPLALILDAGSYSCIVTSTLNGTTVTATSSSATLLVVVPPNISMQPQSVTVVAGSPASLGVTATGSGDVAYQWEKNGTAITGATSSTLTFGATTADDAGTYKCVVTNTDHGFTVTTASSDATITIAVPALLTASGDVTVAAGASASLSVTATVAPGMSAPTFQWQHNGTSITGATGGTYTIHATTASDAGSYVCVVSSSVNGVAAVSTSNPITVTVVAHPVITGQPTGDTLNSGGSLTLAVTATAENMIGYQWLLNGTALPGATSASYAIPSATANDAGDYTCVVSNTLNGVTATTLSAVATVVVEAAPVITGQPADQVVMETQTATFTVTAAGSGLTYQWMRDGSPIMGATSASYTTAPLSLADSGATFSCTISNGYQPDPTTRAALLTVNLLPTVFNASSTTISKGEGVILTFIFAGTATLQAGAGTPVSVTSGGNVVDYPLANTTYSLAVTNHGSTTSMSLTVAVKTYVPKHLYVANYAGKTVARFDFGSGATPVGNGHTAGTVPTGTGPVHIAVSPDNSRLYVANHESANISAFSIDPTSGALTAITGSPFALGTDINPFASVVDPSGQRLYVAGDGAVSVFTIDASTGALTRASTLDVTITGRTQGDILLHPSGSFLFVADNGNDVVKTYSVDPLTGALQFVADASSPGGPTGMTLDRSGTLLFTRGAVTTGNDNAVIHVFAVDPYTGTLTSKSDYEGFDSTLGLPFVRGYEYATPSTDPSIPFNPYGIIHHGLAYSRKPGVDVLYDSYHGEAVDGTSLSAYSVNVASALITGDFVNRALPGSPFSVSAWLYNSLADSLAIDRSGTYLLMGSGSDYGDAVLYVLNARGDLTGPQVVANSDEYEVFPGDNPSHAVFTGILQ